jgi:hypothetical protein
MFSYARVLIAAGLCAVLGTGFVFAADAPGDTAAGHGLSRADEGVAGVLQGETKTKKIALFPLITVPEIKAVADKYGVPTKLEKTPDGIPYLVLTTNKGVELGSILAIGCRAEGCQAMVIGTGIKSSVATPDVIRRYDAKPHFAHLLPTDDYVRFELDSLVAGGVTEAQIVNCILVYVDDLKAYVEITSGASASAAGPDFSLGLAEEGKAPGVTLPSWLEDNAAVPGAGPDSAAKMARFIAATTR